MRFVSVACAVSTTTLDFAGSGRLACLVAAGFLALATARWQMLLAALVFSVAMAFVQPPSLAWALDLGGNRRGTAMATMVAAQDTGVGLGASLLGIVGARAGFAQLAHMVPVRVIPVLQAPGGVAPDGLEMGGRIRRVKHVLVSRRHRQASETPHDPCIPDGLPVVSDIGPTSAATAAPDRQRVGGDVPQTEPLGERNRRRRRAVSGFPRQALVLRSARCCIAHATSTS